MNLSTDQSSGTGKAKFLFGVSFDNEPVEPTHEPAVPHPVEERLSLSVSEFEAAKAQSYADGVSAGKAEASSNQQAQLNGLLSVIGNNLQGIATRNAENEKTRDEAIATAIKAIAYKFLPNMAESAGFNEIEAIVKKVLAELRDEPRLVIRVADMHVDACSSRLPQIAKQMAFPGQLIILGEPALGPADCRIEWADGGMERLENNLWAEIERLLAKYAPNGANEVAQQVNEYAKEAALAAPSTIDTTVDAGPDNTPTESPIEGGSDVNE